VIKPYDRNDIKNIIAAINASSLGLTPINDGALVRLNVPALTEERRKELVKVSKKYCEEGKVAVRNVRRDYMDELKKDKSLPEDTRKSLETEIQKATDEYCKKIDEVYAAKEKDIMTI
ncbi:MAG: ribosome-recycling factor, partial [Bacilli bacterium]